MTSKYAHILNVHRPLHDGDSFAYRHPPMPRGKRAKLFAPFDALSGYDEALADVETVYTARPMPDEAKQQERDTQLRELWQLYRSRKRNCKYMGPDRKPRIYEPPVVTLSCFKEASELGGYGTMIHVTGNLLHIDMNQRLLRLELYPERHPEHAEIVNIPMSDIYSCAV